MSGTKPKIFVFCNTRHPPGGGGDWHSMIAIAEDGKVLAGHICSSHAWENHDMGINADGWKRDLYAAHYPDGFEVIGVEDVEGSPELRAAFELNKKRDDYEPNGKAP